MIRYRYLPIVAFVSGLIGLMLHRWQLSTAFEPETGLPVRAPFYAVPSTLTIVLFSFVFLLVCLWMVYGKKQSNQMETKHIKSFHPFVLILVSSFFMLTSTGFTVHQVISQHETSKLTLFFVLCLVLASFSMFLIANSTASQKNLPLNFVWLSTLLCSCTLIIASYNTWAEDPFIWRYFYMVISYLSIMLTHYFIASHMFEKPQTKHIALFSSLAIFLSFITLADSNTMAIQFYLIAQICYFLSAISLFTDSGFHMMTDTTSVTSDAKIKQQDNHPLKEAHEDANTE